MRILGLDIGTKRIGVAISDEKGLTAQAVEVIQRSSLKKDLQRIQTLVCEYNVEKIVVGIPLRMNGTVSSMGKEILEFINKLKKRTQVSIETWDERWSTKMAERILIEADLSRKKRASVRDKVAATFILQGYLDYLRKNLR